MSKNLSDKNRQNRPDLNQNTGQKFVSDDDIIGRTDWLQQGLHRQIRSLDRKSDAPKFVSDEDIVRKRVA
jgi:hypothetical protein